MSSTSTIAGVAPGMTRVRFPVVHKLGMERFELGVTLLALDPKERSALLAERMKNKMAFDRFEGNDKVFRIVEDTSWMLEVMALVADSKCGGADLMLNPIEWPQCCVHCCAPEATELWAVPAPGSSCSVPLCKRCLMYLDLTARQARRMLLMIILPLGAVGGLAMAKHASPRSIGVIAAGVGVLLLLTLVRIRGAQRQLAEMRAQMRAESIEPAPAAFVNILGDCIDFASRDYAGLFVLRNPTASLSE